MKVKLRTQEPNPVVLATAAPAIHLVPVVAGKPTLITDQIAIARAIDVTTVNRLALDVNRQVAEARVRFGGETVQADDLKVTVALSRMVSVRPIGPAQAGAFFEAEQTDLVVGALASIFLLAVLADETLVLKRQTRRRDDITGRVPGLAG